MNLHFRALHVFVAVGEVRQMSFILVHSIYVQRNNLVWVHFCFVGTVAQARSLEPENAGVNNNVS